MDLLTLFTIYAFLQGVSFTALVINWRINRAIPGTGCWAAGSGLGALGLLLIAVFSARDDLIIVDVVGNFSAWAAIWFYLAGINRFLGRARPNGGVVLATFAVLGLITIYLSFWTGQGLGWRIVIGSAILSVVCLQIVAALVFSRDTRLAAMVFIAAFFAAYASIHGIRGVVTMGDLDLAVYPRAIDGLLTFVGILGTCWTTVGLVIMTTQRLQHQKDTIIGELRQTEAALVQSKRVAEAASRAKTSFLAHMSHELRTPLNAVIGFSEALQRGIAGPLNDKQANYVGDIRHSGEHLLALINDVLDLSKIEAGKLAIAEEEIHLDRAVYRALPFVKEQAMRGGIELSCETDDKLPALRADQRMVMQMIVNLLSNAVKFTPRGGTVTVRAGNNEDEGLYLQISDTGIGIAVDDIPRVMIPFEQTDSGRAKPGTGLGLPLVKRMAELHGATLRLESERGRGTVATILFPASRVVREAQ